MPLDVGIGILLGLVLGPEQTVIANALLGVVFVLLPDADVIVFYLLRSLRVKRFKDHRELFHYPLVYIGLGTVILLAFQPAWIPLFVAASLAQFLHDSIGIGWGIPWLYPFSNRYFKFFYQYDLHRAKQPQKFMWVWSKSEQRELLDKYGDPDWHKHTFQVREYAFWWHVAEIVVLLIGLLVLATQLF